MTGEGSGDLPPVTFTAHPVRERPLTGFLVVALVTGLSVLGGLALGPGLRFMGWVFAVLMLGQLSGFFLPTTYALDAAGITIRHGLSVRRRPWSHFRRVELDSRRAFLSPFRRPRALDRFRGLTVPLEGAPPRARALLSERARALGGDGAEAK